MERKAFVMPVKNLWHKNWSMCSWCCDKTNFSSSFTYKIKFTYSTLRTKETATRRKNRCAYYWMKKLHVPLFLSMRALHAKKESTWRRPIPSFYAITLMNFRGFWILELVNSNIWDSRKKVKLCRMIVVESSLLKKKFKSEIWCWHLMQK